MNKIPVRLDPYIIVGVVESIYRVDVPNFGSTGVGVDIN
jgi:hypothetical protein